jgi:hypothetical protein
MRVCMRIFGLHSGKHLQLRRRGLYVRFEVKLFLGGRREHRTGHSANEKAHGAHRMRRRPVSTRKADMNNSRKLITYLQRSTHGDSTSTGTHTSPKDICRVPVCVYCVGSATDRHRSTWQHLKVKHTHSAESCCTYFAATHASVPRWGEICDCCTQPNHV